MTSLAELMCVPCRGGDPPLSPAEIEAMRPEVPDWQVVEEDGVPKLTRTFKFKNFAQALAFTNRVGEIAEEQDHHPVLVTEWGKVTVTWWTHAIAGLHRNDFIMAARSDELYK
ncbi:MAG: 4a-hydroxytetrahydrobiopterin dehydratase [Anaerolineales bacterium]|nr:4a-hydroxytetrahydrobiopterin dehydratase [Anaerolineales bacterium]